MLKRSTIEDIIIIAIILLFLNFFSLTTIADNSTFGPTALYLVGFGMIVFCIVRGINKRPVEKHPLDWFVFVFILSMFISSVMAFLYWDQPLNASMKSYSYFYIYVLYFVLVYLEVPPERVERIFQILFFTSLIIFLIDYVTFPKPIFSWRSEERRNGITIFFYGQGFTFLGAYYYLNKFFKSKNLFHLTLFIISFTFLFFLTQARMNLLALVLVFFFTLMASDFKQKYLVTFFLLIGAASFYLTSSVFNSIKEESSDQAENVREDVRVLAHTYFLTELQAGVPTVLFGNGVPSAGSNLGIENLKARENGYWTADLGLTGIFSYFGILGTLMWVLFFYSVFKIGKSERSTYLKGYFLTLLTTAFVAYSIFEPGYMPATILVLYLVRCDTLQFQEIED